MHSKNILINYSLSILLLLTSVPALATNLIIDAGNLTPTYRIAGVPGHHSGITTFDLSEETSYRVYFGSQNNGFNFHIDASGKVNSNTTRATIEGNTIKVITSPVTIDPKLYDMTYHTGRYTSGYRIINVVPAGLGTDDFGDRWILILGDQNNGFFFYVDANGVISSNSSRFNIVGANTITFTTIPVLIDPERFDMNYNMAGRHRVGIQTINLVPGGTGSDDFGSRYKTHFGNLSNGFYIDLDENGLVSTDSTRITVTNGSTITFNTVPVHIDTQLYDLHYIITRAPRRIGPQTIYLVAEGTGSMDYGNLIKMLIGDRTNGLYLRINTTGNLSTNSTRLSIVGGNIITFNNTFPIDFNPGAYTSTYNVAGIWFSGTQTIHLVPAGTGADDFNQGGLKLAASANSSYAIFQVESPCAILPSETVTVGAGTSAIPFNLSCPNLIVDTDEDGVADTSDNCPIIPNPDQLDQDDDGLGNACDDDLDGDQVLNLQDNCPNIENVGQIDFDNDGEGDACDNDSDGDSVPTADDNCPLIPNTAQQDNDNDGAGDACDADDDNDDVSDDFDNCPNQANADQNDSDNDGQGDVCDGDVDGDTVGNDADLCLGTALGLAVNAAGCSGSQYIGLTCITGDFPNHGKYVSCVSHAAKDAVEHGLITNQEKSRFVSQAAKSE